MLILSSITLREFLSKAPCDKLVFEKVSFMHPYIIVYSSGTTGMPKCIVHSGGVRYFHCRVRDFF